MDQTPWGFLVLVSRDRAKPSRQFAPIADGLLQRLGCSRNSGPRTVATLQTHRSWEAARGGGA